MRFFKIVSITSKPICPIAFKEPTLFRYSKIATPFEYAISTGFILNGSRVIAHIDCSFELKMHPRAEEFIEFAYQRGVQAELYPDHSEYKDIVKDKIRKSYFVYLGVNTIPESTDQKKLEELVTWILLLFAFDNVIDNPKGKLPHDESKLKWYVSILQNKLKGNGLSTEEIRKSLMECLDEEEVDLALKPIRLALTMTSHSRSFLSETKRYLESSLTEIEHGTDMSLAAYMKTRETSGAIDTVVRLAEGDVPEYLSSNINFQRMNAAIVTYIWGVNDIGGAKEWKGHEPAYLKIQTKHHFTTFQHAKDVRSNTELIFLSFNMAFEDLITLINDSHKEYFNFKQLVLNSIDDGSIFSDTSVEEDFEGKSAHDKALFKAAVRADFITRCAIRENLAVAGNECTRVSSRYFEPTDPEKNIEVMELVRGLHVGTGLSS